MSEIAWSNYLRTRLGCSYVFGNTSVRFGFSEYFPNKKTETILRLENLDVMFETGFYINDLSMHDSSRDLVLVGTQQSAELKQALDLEKTKSKALEESMKKLDTESKRTDQLLYQMIPKKISDRLRSGEPVMNLCEVWGFELIF